MFQIFWTLRNLVMGLKLPTRINLNERSVLKLKLHGKLITKLTLKPISLQILSILISLVLCHRHLHMVAYTQYVLLMIIPDWLLCTFWKEIPMLLVLRRYILPIWFRTVKLRGYVLTMAESIPPKNLLNSCWSTKLDMNYLHRTLHISYPNASCVWNWNNLQWISLNKKSKLRKK